MKFASLFSGCLGTRADRDTATTEIPDGTTSAQSSRSSVVTEPSTHRSVPRAGWFSKVRTWAAGLCCGVQRSKPADARRVIQLREALTSDEVFNGADANTVIEGAYDLKLLESESSRARLTQLRTQGASFERLKVTGRIDLSDPKSGDAVRLLACVTASSANGNEPAGADVRGVKVVTSQALPINDPAAMQQLAAVVACPVKLDTIKFKGKMNREEELQLAADTLSALAGRRAKVDLKEVSEVSLGLTSRSPAASTERMIGNIKLLMVSGANAANVNISGVLNLDVDPLPQLRSLVSLADDCCRGCIGSTRTHELCEGLYVHVNASTFAAAPASAKLNDVSEALKLLVKLQNSGARIMLQGDVINAGNSLDALLQMAGIPEVVWLKVRVISDPMRGVVPADGKKLEALRKLGVTFDDATVLQAAKGGSAVFQEEDKARKKIKNG
jgi:hypothetical protein